MASRIIYKTSSNTNHNISNRNSNNNNRNHNITYYAKHNCNNNNRNSEVSGIASKAKFIFEHPNTSRIKQAIANDIKLDKLREKLLVIAYFKS